MTMLTDYMTPVCFPGLIRLLCLGLILLFKAEYLNKASAKCKMYALCEKLTLNIQNNLFKYEQIDTKFEKRRYL